MLSASFWRRRLSAPVVFCAAAAAAAGAAAQSFELPAETWLEPLAIVLELDGAAVEVVREPTSKPALRARLRSPSGASPVLDVVRGPGQVTLRRGGAASEPIVLELILDLGQPLRIAGSELDVLITGVGPSGGGTGDGEEEPEAAGAALTGTTAPTATLLELGVERSTVQLTGVDGAVVDAVDSSLFTDVTGGSLILRLRGGDAEIRNHRGTIDLRGHAAEVWLGDPEGGISFAIEDGSLRLRGGRGHATGSAAGGAVELDGWFGPASFSGSDATLEVRSDPELRSTLTLTGAGLDATVSGLAGMLSADLRGGRLRLTDKLGNTRIQASDGAEVSIERAAGNTTLSLQQSSALLADVRAPQIKVDLRGGRLDGERIRHLELTAEGGEVRVADLEELAKAEVADTRMELDLTRLEKTPVVTLRGASEALLRLATPCAVELSDDQLLSDRIGITGCEFYGASNRRGRIGDRYKDRGVEGNRRLTLRATVAEDSHLEVEGYP